MLKYIPKYILCIQENILTFTNASYYSEDESGCIDKVSTFQHGLHNRMKQLIIKHNDVLIALNLFLEFKNNVKDFEALSSITVSSLEMVTGSWTTYAELLEERRKDSHWNEYENLIKRNLLHPGIQELSECWLTTDQTHSGIGKKAQTVFDTQFASEIKLYRQILEGEETNDMDEMAITGNVPDDGAAKKLNQQLEQSQQQHLTYKRIEENKVTGPIEQKNEMIATLEAEIVELRAKKQDLATAKQSVEEYYKIKQTQSPV